MATKKKTAGKKTAYTSAQIRKLESIPYAQGTGPHSKRIEALAEKFGKSYGSLWQKWYAIHKEKLKPMSPVSDDVNAMSFKDIPFEEGGRKVGLQEELSMQKGLVNAMLGPLSQIGRAVLVPTRLERKARIFLNKEYPENVFVFHVYPKDKKFKQLSKKA